MVLDIFYLPPHRSEHSLISQYQHVCFNPSERFQCSPRGFHRSRCIKNTFDIRSTNVQFVCTKLLSGGIRRGFAPSWMAKLAYKDPNFNDDKCTAANVSMPRRPRRQMLRRATARRSMRMGAAPTFRRPRWTWKLQAQDLSSWARSVFDFG